VESSISAHFFQIDVHIQNFEPELVETNSLGSQHREAFETQKNLRGCFFQQFGKCLLSSEISAGVSFETPTITFSKTSANVSFENANGASSQLGRADP
jgi:hypothetical protein